MAQRRFGNYVIYSGLLSALETRTLEDGTEVMVGTLSHPTKGDCTVVTGGKFLDRVRSLMVEGADVRLCGFQSRAELGAGEATRFVVVGPDLMTKPLVAEVPVTEPAPVVAKRPQTEKQRIAWANIRAMRAERRAARATEPVAA